MEIKRENRLQNLLPIDTMYTIKLNQLELETIFGCVGAISENKLIESLSKHCLYRKEQYADLSYKNKLLSIFYILKLWVKGEK